MNTTENTFVKKEPKKCLTCEFFTCNTSAILDLSVKTFSGYCDKGTKNTEGRNLINSDYVCELWEKAKFLKER